MFGTKSKQNPDEVLDHWIASADNFSYSPEEFYQIVQQQLEAIEVPGLEISKKEYAEGGVLSSQRIYLRLIRERLPAITVGKTGRPVFRFFSFDHACHIGENKSENEKLKKYHFVKT
jgi:hypothetical protein